MNSVSVEELQDLYIQAKYQEIKKLVDEGDMNANDPHDASRLLLLGWSHHQLGEYDDSMAIMSGLMMAYEADTEIGESARRGLAHGILQSQGGIQRADNLLLEIPPSLARDNVRMNQMIVAARKGFDIPGAAVMTMITNALGSVPYATVNGHVVNNGALAFHEARQQEGVKPYLSVLPGLIGVAIGIYETTGAAKNHRASALFRASQIFEAADWPEGAIVVIQESIAFWRELVATQGGERYQNNLEGALAQLEKLKEA